LWMQDRIRKPVSEIGRLATVAAVLVRLAVAVVGAGRAPHPNVEMIVVSKPWANLLKPAAVAPGLAAQRLLDRGVDQESLHARRLRRVANDREMSWCKHPGVDIEPVVAHHHGRRHLFALLAGQAAIRHRREPDVGIEPDLVAGMAGKRRPSARLSDVADEDA